jgi:deazaflavin-dependent oxidoreductase (nitroreductase family)
MDTALQAAFEHGGVIDITTVGARTGQPRRIEINFIALNGSYYITGRPGHKRDWLANLKAYPDFTVHLKRGMTMDLQAEARIITDPAERENVLYRILTESWGNEVSKADHILPRWVESAPLVEFEVV